MSRRDKGWEQAEGTSELQKSISELRKLSSEIKNPGLELHASG